MPRAEIATLRALARGALGDGYSPEVPFRMREVIGWLAAEKDRNQLLSTLRALDTRFGALALTGVARPVSWLNQREAEALLQKWLNSRVPTQRRLASSLTAMSLAAVYGYPGPEWERIGYPGPSDQTPARLEKLTVEELGRDAVLDCDVVVVGSGAGGGCAAAILAEAGLDVVVLEKGAYLAEDEFDHVEANSLRDMYLYGMTLATRDLGVRIIAGSVLGGGTAVNYTTSFRAPDFILEEWARESGVEAFLDGEIQESFDSVSERLGVNTDSSAAGRRDEVMEEGLKKLGWHVDMLPRAVRGCSQDEACGYCGFGCRIGAKQSTMRTYLHDAQRAGARIITGVDVRRVLVSNGRAVGVEGRRGSKRITVNGRAVVAAGGSIESPALLLRSGLGGQVGRNLHLHPGTAAMGVFDEDVRIWEGTLQARYCAEFRHWDGGYGPIFETVPVHPGSGAVVVPWLSADHHRDRMAGFGNIGFVAVLPRDRGGGRVRIGRDGNPLVEYRLQPDDDRRISEGVAQAGRVMEAAGAKEVYSMHPSFPSYRTGSPGAYDRWAEEVRSLGYARGRSTMFSYHQMSSCRMGMDPSRSAIDADNQTHEVRDLYVMDASAFPTASGVNPMLSVYAIAHRAATRLAKRLQ
jgi:choline dehydrogenase-like flavoprotein